ncbi:alpha-glucan family phosphorylase [Ferribacterium limneticum]|uniref:alpha-glucan family phosphorylase n=1 Tax=Ferribacterium limneticum TaxID=76259 RepID=UPI001CFAFC4F|nr:alpha-glucan family phosphorylase [Ferribacterium limneticum]UCV29120.1 alpha-glucan family phosphorylase [Ferribacterium limneticum]UCV33038.1 alpha-glucan family phosphorylase [Ferribacterium limneticum]
MTGTVFNLEVNPQLPERLERLEELSNNLWYSWDRPTQGLFASLSHPLWRATNHNPKAFLKRADQKRLEAIAEDPVFLGALNRVVSSYDTYHEMPNMAHVHGQPFADDDLIAYFCAEFGFHESLPIYSGGLGILAGDHCKAASDMGLPFIGVGLLYRQGYFQQTLTADGHQQATYNDSDFDDLPVTPVLDADGQEVLVAVEFPGRSIQAKVWEVTVGHVRLILLDTWLPINSARDREITHRLYGGDKTTRIEQEILLGVGGTRALAALGLKPTVWHVNEGHAAFLILERIRSLIKGGLPYAAALEAVASNVVFTTHTPVPAGHDHFPEEMIRNYFGGWCGDLGLSCDHLMGLGAEPGKTDFNMTALALRGSRHHNGVSRIHGDVSADICRYLWPQILPEENPMDYVTNGVHLPTFLAPEWFETFEHYLGIGWQERQTQPANWNGIDDIPDATYWSIRQQLKSKLLKLVRERIREQHHRNQGSPSHLDRLLKYADPDNPNILTIGFARRFATYKRAALLFQDPTWLREIITQAGRPVLFLFAGKAHPADLPGQEIIRKIAEMAKLPEFEGRILLVEGYDLHLSRSLVAGVDVWLNNPIYPLEASGTSGMKAAMNGALNLSVLDGWWGEGYDEGDDGIANGWAIKPVPGHLSDVQRDAEEARTLYELLQDQVIPTYYRTGPMGYSPEWVAMSKRSIATISPRFNVTRMVSEYVKKFYAPAAGHGRQYFSDNFAVARHVADWKTKVRAAWPGVRLHRIDTPERRLKFGGTVRIELAVQLNGLRPEDVTLEALFGRPGRNGGIGRVRHYPLTCDGQNEYGEMRYHLELTPELCGKLEYRIRIFPTHASLIHPLETGLMIWL